MSLVNMFALDLDLKRTNYISEPVITSNDSVTFVINITDNGTPLDLTSMSAASIGHTRPDGVVVLKAGTKTGPNQLTFDFGSTEISVPGRVDAKVQIFDIEDRVSTLNFGYTVTKDPSGSTYIPSSNEQTLIDMVLGEGAQILADAESATIDAQSATTNANNAASNATTTAVNIQAAEDDRVISENIRVASEDDRIVNDLVRSSNETTRQTNEITRQTQEDTRVDNETTRQSNESTRQTDTSTAISDANLAATAATNAATSANNLVNTFVSLGPYDPETYYVPNNIVTYDGSSWRCLVDSFGNMPVEGVYWTLMASKGSDGTGVGTVTSVSSANGDIVVIDPTVNPILTLNVGSGANQIVKRNVSGEIDDVVLLDEKLTPMTHPSVTLNNGVQIVQGGDIPAILHPEMSGRTLINVTGRDGNCESLAPFIQSGGVPVTISTTQKRSGTNSIKVMNSGTQAGYVYKDYTYPLISSKQYILAGWVYIESRTTGVFPYLQLCDVGTFQGRYSATAIATIGAWQFIYVKIPTANTLIGSGFRLIAGLAAIGDCVAYQDGIRLYEVSAADYAAIGTTITGEAIDKFLPYVDDMKHVNAVYVENKGKNLSGDYWEANGIDSANGNDATATTRIRTGYINVIPSTTYTLSCVTGYQGRIYEYTDDSYISASATFDNPLTFTTSATTKKIRIALRNSDDITAIDTYLLSVIRPMLNIGVAALSFKPHKPSYLYFPDVQLTSNADGSVKDELYADEQGKPKKTKRFGQMVLNGSLSWAFGNDFSGFKRVYVPTISDMRLDENQVVVKYDGKILVTATNSTEADRAYRYAGGFYISIADTESGWGETYTPTAAEIQAYFYGWRMYNAAVGGTTPYDGTGTKSWIAIGGNGLYLSGTETATLPTVTYVTSVNTYTPYRLMYQLATSVDEAVKHEGSLMLHDGANQVEVGTGVVLREAAPIAYISAGYRYLNFGNASAYFKKRAIRVLSLFKGQVKDNVWELNYSFSPTQNGMGIRALASNYDPTAEYSVTYLALDTYSLGIAPQTINTEYAPNIREGIDLLIREVVEARTEISVLRNTKAQKQNPQWITPTLLNGWLANGGTTPAYYKNDMDETTISARLTGGTTTNGTIIFTLPKDYGYRPLSNVTFKVISGIILVDPSGNVTLYGYSADPVLGDLRFDITFRGGQ